MLGGVNIPGFGGGGDGGMGLAALAPIQALVNGGQSYMNMRMQAQMNERMEANSWGMFNAEKELANTAHQREVADLKAAGLNPILSTHGQGSASPSGSAPGLTAPQIQMPDFFSMGVSLKQLEQVDKKLQIDQQMANISDRNSASQIAVNLLQRN